jgi:hypothetical protein
MAEDIIDKKFDLRRQLLSLRAGSTAAELRNRIIEVCAANNYDPVTELLEIVNAAKEDTREDLRKLASTVKDPDLAEQMRVIASKILPLDVETMISIHKELLQYIAPKLRSTEIKGDVDVNIHVTVTKFGEAKTIDMKEIPK